MPFEVCTASFLAARPPRHSCPLPGALQWTTRPKLPRGAARNVASLLPLIVVRLGGFAPAGCFPATRGCPFAEAKVGSGALQTCLLLPSPPPPPPPPPPAAACHIPTPWCTLSCLPAVFPGEPGLLRPGEAVAAPWRCCAIQSGRRSGARAVAVTNVGLHKHSSCLAAPLQPFCCCCVQFGVGLCRLILVWMANGCPCHPTRAGPRRLVRALGPLLAGCMVGWPHLLFACRM